MKNIDSKKAFMVVSILLLTLANGWIMGIELSSEGKRYLESYLEDMPLVKRSSIEDMEIEDLLMTLRTILMEIGFDRRGEKVRRHWEAVPKVFASMLNRSKVTGQSLEEIVKVPAQYSAWDKLSEEELKNYLDMDQDTWDIQRAFEEVQRFLKDEERRESHRDVFGYYNPWQSNPYGPSGVHHHPLFEEKGRQWVLDRPQQSSWNPDDREYLLDLGDPISNREDPDRHIGVKHLDWVRKRSRGEEGNQVQPQDSTSSSGAPTSSSSSVAGPLTYTVQRGDVLSRIGEKHNVDYRDITRQGKPIENPDLIQEGWELDIPKP